MIMVLGNKQICNTKQYKWINPDCVYGYILYSLTHVKLLELKVVHNRYAKIII